MNLALLDQWADLRQHMREQGIFGFDAYSNKLQVDILRLKEIASDLGLEINIAINDTKYPVRANVEINNTEIYAVSDLGTAQEAGVIFSITKEGVVAK